MTTILQLSSFSISEDASTTLTTAFQATSSSPASNCATSIYDIFIAAEKFSHSNNILIQWLRDGYLISTSKNNDMTLKKATSTTDGDIFFCKTCAAAKSVRDGSFFFFFHKIQTTS